MGFPNLSNPISMNNFKWKGRKGHSAFYFNKVMTDVGYCPSFNLLESSEIFKYDSYDEHLRWFTEVAYDGSLSKPILNWSPETGYTDDFSFKTFPLRLRVSGANAGFELRLSSDAPCRRITEGSRILIHSPTDWPYMSKNFIQISHNQKYTIVLKPQIITTSPTLKSYNYAE
jgi:amiloride-sensitive sodium channel